ncbi:MAG: hypothetical protein CME88_02750 [Hirschia sp.]|nr:hypothetical protein [Hirschia sp.]MBF17281.1 hypothetical protein [Hirschia sp.]
MNRLDIEDLSNALDDIRYLCASLDMASRGLSEEREQMAFRGLADAIQARAEWIQGEMDRRYREANKDGPRHLKSVPSSGT